MSPRNEAILSPPQTLAFLRALSRDLDVDRAANSCGLSRDQVRDVLSSLCELYASGLENGCAPTDPHPPSEGTREGSALETAPGAELQIYIDGASRGNPGPAAAGIVLKDRRGREFSTIKRRLGHVTNNVAEYRALLLGLEEATRLRAQRITLFSDSELLVRQMQGLYKVRSKDLRPLHAKATALVRAFVEFDIIHIGREKNARADALANEALDEHSSP